MSTPSQLFTNNAVSLLAAPITAGSTSLTVMSGFGNLFPQPVDAGDFFLVTLENQTGTAREIIKVEGRTGDTFTNITRAQEGTTAQAWSASLGNDTLVDHRVTAETMRQAFLQPVGGSGISGVNIEDRGVPVATPATTLNFTGNVTITDNGASKDVNIGALTPPIIGETSTLPTTIPGGTAIAISEGTYSDLSRGFKFYVTLIDQATKNSATFEVMCNISGDLSTNSETSSFSRYGRVGFNFRGSVIINLNTATKAISLEWQNGEAYPVQAMSIRIQQLA